MVNFTKDELKLILSALETIQQARQSLTSSAVIDGDYMKADAAWKNVAEREQIIKRIEEHLKRNE
jgi:hypothetical protein